MNVGERIKEIRIAKGLKQKDVAASAHITASFLCRIEKGTANPSLPTISDLAKALDVPPQSILDNITLTCDDNTSVSEQIKIIIERFPLSRQKELLAVLEFLASNLH